MLLSLCAVALGGGAGAVVRASCDKRPWGLWFVNILGSLIMGILYALLEHWAEPLWADTLLLAVGVGYCGGLTTFSTVSLRAALLIRHKGIMRAFLFLFLMVSVVFTAAWGGYYGCSHLIALLMESS